jgi:hypothetical protein
LSQAADTIAANTAGTPTEVGAQAVALAITPDNKIVYVVENAS